jgi:TAT (twin-arginine translocation) pathway signal sequence.
MVDDSEVNRRRFLRATGAVAATVGVAGCSQGGDEGTETQTPDDNGGPTSTEFSRPSSYPYSPGETDVQSARSVMEEAGFGPDNRYELSWTQYTSPTWKEIANTVALALSLHISI